MEDLVVVEVKSVDALAAIHHVQLLSYLKLSAHKLGILINFNTVHLKHGIKRAVNGCDFWSFCGLRGRCGEFSSA